MNAKAIRPMKALAAAILAALTLLCVCRAGKAEETAAYYYYSRKYADAARPETELAVDLTQCAALPSAGAELYREKEGSPQGIWIHESCREATFRVDVPETGLYNLEITYFPFSESELQLLFGLKIDGASPFTEAGGCVVSRVYQNEEIQQDAQGNDVRPRARQKSVWRTQYLQDQTEINGNLSFYLEKGSRDITLLFEEASLLIERIVFKQEPYRISYQDYISLYKQKGYTPSENVRQIYQAENYYLQSNSTLWPGTDRSSLLTQPFSYTKTLINYGGGSQWKEPGQWISWRVYAPEDGFYNIGFKYRQGYLDGLFSSRRILIDGETPFDELNAVRFNYTAQWENLTLGNGYEPYGIYLTAGEHVLTLENVLGDMNDTVSVLQTCVNNLNDLYLSIVMITGSEPDKYRDYYLQRLLPGLAGDLRENAGLLFEEAERLIAVVGARGKETAFFEDIAYDLESYAAHIGDLTHKSRLTDLKNNISSLSTKMMEYQEQALDLDYFVLLSPGEEMPRVKMTAAEWAEYQSKMFAASFETEQPQAERGSIRVWMSGGNEQYEIIRRMTQELFTARTGIPVELELVTGSLIQAVVAGIGPDVYIGVGGDSIVNMAIRGALEELDGYPGYAALMDEYIAGSAVPFTLEGRTYAIPNTGSFSMMFVRTDIFERLGLEAPQTWDEVYDVAQVLQRNNMSLGVVPAFATFLYQSGGSYYDERLTRVMFDTDVAVSAFKQQTEFYTKYGFPLSFDFLSRFRTGEMPIALSSYSTYNSLKYSAPEISGLWKMYPIPGTVQQDGSVNGTQAAGAGTGVAMMKQAKNKSDAWEFIRWWSGAEAQTRYGRDLEAAMGVSARYNTLNKLAFPQLGWTQEEYGVLAEEISKLQFTPVVPGDYYVGRGVNNTFRAVVYDGENVRELLESWTIKINEELSRKRKEFYENN